MLIVRVNCTYRSIKFWPNACESMLLLLTHSMITLLKALRISFTKVILTYKSSFTWSWYGSDATFTHWQGLNLLLIGRLFRPRWLLGCFTLLWYQLFERHLNALDFLLIVCRLLYASFLDLVYIVLVIIGALRKGKILFFLSLFDNLLWIHKVFHNFRIRLILLSIIFVERMALVPFLLLIWNRGVLLVSMRRMMLIVHRWWRLSIKHELLVVAWRVRMRWQQRLVEMLCTWLLWRPSCTMMVHAHCYRWWALVPILVILMRIHFYCCYIIGM